MMYTNKGSSSSIKSEGRIESLADDIFRGDFLKIGSLVADACRLLVQFSAEGHLAVREEYDEDERKRQCNWAVETAAEEIYVNILPNIFCSIIYDQEEDWEPIEEIEEVSVIGLSDDVVVVYLEGLPLAVAVFGADEYEPEESELSEEVVLLASNRIEAIRAIYVDEAVVDQLGLEKDEVGAYLEMLISKTMERFTFDSNSCEMFRPTITIAKNQEGYFSQMADEYLWGKTESEAGYLIFN